MPRKRRFLTNWLHRLLTRYRIWRRMEQLDGEALGWGIILSLGGRLSRAQQKERDKNRREWLRLGAAKAGCSRLLGTKPTFKIRGS